MNASISNSVGRTPAMPARLTGGCLCGRIRYSASSQDAFTCVCHCKSCQRQTGSAFSVLVGIPAGAVEISGGSLAEVTTTGDSGRLVRRKFCRDCGSPIYSTAEVRPEVSWLKAGTLDDTDWLSPVLHIWAAQKQAWVAQTRDVTWLPGSARVGSGQ